MRLHEYEAAEIFSNAGIPVPRQRVASSPGEALHIAGEIGYPVMLKVQVLVGGRGIAGGILTARDPDEVGSVSQTLLTMKVKGFPVRTLLVAGMEDVERELYLGVTIDGYEGKPVVVVSAEGGVSIEEAARKSPEKIASLHIEPAELLLPYQAREVLSRIELPVPLRIRCADILVRLYEVFRENDALIAEINPLGVRRDGEVVALDAVLELDDSALFRSHVSVPRKSAKIENDLERRGAEIGVTYVDLEGDIGIIASGAGLGMATMDIIGQRYRPANFLETGGAITEELLYRSMELVMMKKGIRAVVINVYGGINPIHEGACGIARYIGEHSVTVPVITKALGNHQEETWNILRSAGVHVVTDVATEKVAERLYELLGEEGITQR